MRRVGLKVKCPECDREIIVLDPSGSEVRKGKIKRRCEHCAKWVEMVPLSVVESDE